MPVLKIDMTEWPGGVTMTIAGEMDVAGVPEFERQFNVALERKKPRIVLDLSGVTFIGSLGMGYLVTARRLAAKSNCEITLACLKPMIAEALRRAALYRAFSAYPTVAEAIAAPPRASNPPPVAGK